MRASSIIKYDFMGNWRSTIAENIRVGFTTTNPKGFLLGFFSNITKEYLTIMISNSGAFLLETYFTMFNNLVQFSNVKTSNHYSITLTMLFKQRCKYSERTKYDC